MASVTVTGPFFTPGHRQQVMAAAGREARQEVGQQGLANVHKLLDAQIKHPTPYYETQPTLQERAGAAIVHDRGVIYGPWLEGTSRRNQTTRFKGYASFRKATQELDGQVPRLTAHVATRAAARLS